MYRLLSSSAFIVGLWRGSGSIARSHLYEFHWEVDCIVGTGLRYESMRSAPPSFAKSCTMQDAFLFACCVLMGTELCIWCAARLSAIRSSFHRIGPDRLITPELISDKHCVLRQTHINQKTPSRAAESVAAVAMNSFGVSKICCSP